MKNLISYPGGKYFAIKTLSQYLPTDINEYREPFCGGASMFFYLQEKGLAQTYWINDLYSNLINFYRTVQEKGNSLVNHLYLIKTSGEEKGREVFKQDCADPITFFVRNRCSFSGTTEAGGFSSLKFRDRFTYNSISKISVAQTCLKDVKITNLDFEEVISYKGSGVFLFVDPPYYTASKLYGKNGELHQFDHERLALLLKRTKHKFMLTYDDCSEIRNLYEWAHKTPYSLQYGMNNCNKDKTSKIGEELIIRNYY